jgi:hypothetical protein
MVTDVLAAGVVKATVPATPDGAVEPVALLEEEVPDPGTVVAEPLLWKSFSLKDKREFVQAMDTIVATGLSCRKACCQLRVSHMYYIIKD